MADGPPKTPTPDDRYAEAEARHEAALTGLAGRSHRLTAARGAAFLIAALAAVLAGDLPWPPAISWMVAVAVGAAFVLLVVRHRAVKREIERAEHARELARLGRARRARDGARIREIAPEVTRVPEAAGREHPYAYDLDLFGESSVRALLGPTPSPVGGRVLSDWLLSRSESSEVRARQTAVADLASRFDAREALAVEGRLAGSVSEAAWSRFGEWLRSPGPFVEGGLPRWALPVARVLPVVFLGAGVADLAGVDVHNLAWGVPLAIQAVLAWRWRRVIEPWVGELAESGRALRRYGPVFRRWSDLEVEDAGLRSRIARLAGGEGTSAAAEVARFERAVDLVESRASIVYLIFGVGMLADVHIAARVARWRDRAGDRVEGWFEALGELEALSALATLAHDQPEWAFPELVEAGGEGEAAAGGVPGPIFEAEGLGHPLLADADRRTNDITLDPPGRFLLVTGSNMSGKSTLLRSIGLAAVLAQAGAPVCARRCRMTPLETFTSMRIQDSLAGGVSLFMAELERLKALVDAAPPAGSEGPALLYLIDEVLQGTNSEERRVAARRIVAHLLGRRAIGAVTTHDLTLHEDPRIDPKATKVHLRESVGGPGEPAITFDYLLRPGLATSRNALALLEMIGIGESGDGDADVVR